MVADFSTGADRHPGLLAMEEESRLQLEEEIIRGVTTSPYPRLELAKIARWNQVPQEVMENTAQTVIKRRLGLDLEELEFQQVVKAVQRLELEEPDAGMREWKLQGIARRLRRTPRQIMDAYNKALCQQKPVKPLTIKEFREQASRDTDWLIQGWIPQGSCVLLHAEGGTGKTLMTYEIVEAVLAGKPWNGYKTAQGGVLLVQVDEPSLVTAERMDIRGIRDDQPLFVLPDWQVEAMVHLETYLAESKPSLVVIDSLTAINRNCIFSENDTEYARPVLQLTNLADKYGCAIIIIHHSNAEGNSRGTRAIYNSVSEVWGLSAPNISQRLLRVQKTRMGRPPGRYKFDFDEEDFSFHYMGEESEDNDEAANQEERVRLWLSEEAQKGVRFSSLEISEYLGLTRHCARRACYELWSKGLIKRGRPQGEKFYLYYSGVVENSLTKLTSDPSDQWGVSPLITCDDFKTPAQQDIQSSDQCDQCDQRFFENSQVKFLKKDGSLGSLDHLASEPAPGMDPSSDQSEGQIGLPIDHLPPTDHLLHHSFTKGDEVVLVGDAVKTASSNELAAVWTVRGGDKWIRVFNSDLGDRKFPVDWLALLRGAVSPYS